MVLSTEIKSWKEFLANLSGVHVVGVALPGPLLWREGISAVVTLLKEQLWKPLPGSVDCFSLCSPGRVRLRRKQAGMHDPGSPNSFTDGSGT